MAVEEEYPSELVESVLTLSKLVTAKETVSSTVQRIAELSVKAIDGAEFASISVATGGKVKTVASTSDAAGRLDDVQYETKEGPCLSSIEKHATFYIQDMNRDDTWPTFSKRAAEETGVNTLLAYVLAVHEDSLGALNIMATKTDAIPQSSRDVGAIFAAHAGVALSNAIEHQRSEQQIHQLEEGMLTRQVIGQAVGLVMATRQVGADAAFHTLKEISQQSNVKIREIAEQLVERAQDL